MSTNNSGNNAAAAATGNKNEGKWNRNFAALLRYRDGHGGSLDALKKGRRRARVALELYNWCQYQRKKYEKGTLPEHRSERLRRIGFDLTPSRGGGGGDAAASVDREEAHDDDDDASVDREEAHGNDKYEEAWNKNFAALLKFRDSHGGSLRVPCKDDWDVYGGANLYLWCWSQRQQWEKGTLPEHRRNKLRKIGFEQQPMNESDDEDKYEAKWNKNFAALLRYRDSHGGSLRVPFKDDWDTYGGTNLYAWCRMQRKAYCNLMNGEKGAIRKRRLEKLRQIGFDFATPEEAKEKGEETKDKGEETKAADNSTARDKDTSKKRKRDNDESWNDHFAALLRYRDDKNGNFPSRPKEDWTRYGGKNLYNWCQSQRKKYRYLINGDPRAIKQHRLEKLREIEFNFPTEEDADTKTRDELWDENFAALLDFRDRNGCDINSVANKVEWNGLKIGKWASNQRSRYRNNLRGKKPSLPLHRLEMLNAVGFDFTPGQGKKKQRTRRWLTWEENYDQLVQAVQQYGREFDIIEAAEPDLESWMDEQRMLYRNQKKGVAPALLPEQLEKLRRIGFNLEPVESRTIEGIAEDDDDADDDQEDRLYRKMELKYLDRLDRRILAVEEEELMSELDKDIALQERTSGVRVEWVSTDIHEYGGCWSTVPTVSSVELKHRSLGRDAPATVPKKHKVIQGSVGGLELIRATKRLPKYYRGTRNYFLTNQDLEEKFLRKLTNESAPEDLMRFKAYVANVGGDPSSIELVAKGRPKTVFRYLNVVHPELQVMVRHHNYNSLLANGVQVDVEIDSNTKLGAKLYEFQDQDTTGVLVDAEENSPSGQLATLLGGVSALTSGAAVVKLGGSPCRSIERFKKVLSDQKDSRITLEIRVSREADFSRIPLSCIKECPEQSVYESLLSYGIRIFFEVDTQHPLGADAAALKDDDDTAKGILLTATQDHSSAQLARGLGFDAASRGTFAESTIIRGADATLVY